MKFSKEYFLSPIFYFIKNAYLNFTGIQVYPGAKIIKSLLEKRVSVYNNSVIFNSSIGRYTYIQRNCTVGNASIGRFCSIAEGVKMGLGIHPVNEFISTHPFCYGANPNHWLYLDSKPPAAHEFTESKRVNVGHDVNIGANSIILDGVNIGNGAIIGAGSVVTRDVQPYAVVAGVPAKLLRYRFDKEECEKISKLEWWDCDPGKLRQDLHKFRRENL